MEIAVQTERRWPDPDRGPWLLRASFAATLDGFIPVGIEMWAITPPTEPQWTRWRPDLATATPTVPLDGQQLRVPFARLAEELSASLAHHLGAIHARHVPQADRLAAATKVRRPRGRPALYSREHFVAVADCYRTLTGPKPTAVLAERYAVSRSTAAHWVSRCRQMGLLTPDVNPKARGRSAQGLVG